VEQAIHRQVRFFDGMTYYPLDQTFDFTRCGSWGFFTFFLTFLWFLSSLMLMWFEIVTASYPKALEEVVESTDARNVSGFETAEDGVVGNTFHFINPFGNADFRFRHEKEKIRTEHRSWITRMRIFDIITILQQKCKVRQVSHPEFYDQMPVIVDNGEDPAGIIPTYTIENRILIRFMWNHNWFQTKSPRVSLVKETNPFRRDYGDVLKKSSVF